MEMDDNKFKEFLQKELDKEADKIMEKVDKDPDLDGVIAPEVIRERLFQQIHELEGEPENEEPELTSEEPEPLPKEPELSSKNPELSPEDQELIRLGKLYKKNRGKGKIYLLGVAIVCILALGITSFGGPEKVFSEMKRMLGDREQTVVNTPGEDGSVIDEISSEEKAYEQIEKTFGFYPIKLIHLPEGMNFVEMDIDIQLQYAQLYYADSKGGSIAYRIVTNNRTSSVGVDIEDVFIQEYEKEINGIIINIKEYEVEENKTKRWSLEFSYKNAQYLVVLTGIEANEVEKLVENLYFS